jgi:hypothetical protein
MLEPTDQMKIWELSHEDENEHQEHREENKKVEDWARGTGPCSRGNPDKASSSPTPIPHAALLGPSELETGGKGRCSPKRD